MNWFDAKCSTELQAALKMNLVADIKCHTHDPLFKNECTGSPELHAWPHVLYNRHSPQMSMSVSNKGYEVGVSTAIMIMMGIWYPAQFGTHYLPSIISQALQCQTLPKTFNHQLDPLYTNEQPIKFLYIPYKSTQFANNPINPPMPNPSPRKIPHKKSIITVFTPSPPCGCFQK